MSKKTKLRSNMAWIVAVVFLTAGFGISWFEFGTIGPAV